MRNLLTSEVPGDLARAMHAAIADRTLVSIVLASPSPLKKMRITLVKKCVLRWNLHISAAPKFVVATCPATKDERIDYRRIVRMKNILSGVLLYEQNGLILPKYMLEPRTDGWHVKLKYPNYGTIDLNGDVFKDYGDAVKFCEFNFA